MIFTILLSIVSFAHAHARTPNMPIDCNAAVNSDLSGRLSLRVNWKLYNQILLPACRQINLLLLLCGALLLMLLNTIRYGCCYHQFRWTALGCVLVECVDVVRSNRMCPRLSALRRKTKQNKRNELNNLFAFEINAAAP